MVAVAAAVVASLLRAGARRRPWSILATAAAVALLLTLTSLSAPLARDAQDVQLRLLAPEAASPAVLVIDIDDGSLAELKPQFGSWPYRRDVYALMVEQLRDLGARAIAIDLLLADGAEGDESLARTLARPGAPVVLAAAGLRHASDTRRSARTLAGATSLFGADGAAALGAPAPPAGAATPALAGAPSATSATGTPGAAASPGGLGGPGGPWPGAGTAPAHPWPTLALPTPSVWPQARLPRLGVITSPLDDDGVLRALPLWHRDPQQLLPVMPWAVHTAVHGAAATPPPLDPRGAYHLAMPLAEAWPPVRRFTELAQVALGQIDAAALQQAVHGRIVYLGSSALLADAVMTPQGQMSGTVALAQATAALAEGHWVRPHSDMLDTALVVLALLPATLTVWRGRPAPARDAAAVALALAAMVGLALWALWQWRQPSEWVTPLATLAVAWAASLAMHQRGQAAARRRLLHEVEVSEEAARAKSAFLANVSHEIRTPLNALLGVAELLAQTELSAKQRLHVQVFRESGQALLSLINDLLDLSRIEAGRFELNPAPFDLHAALARLTALMQVRADDKGLNLVLDVAPGLPVGVLGDRLRLEQALMNLVGNAVKFTSRGSVRLAALPDPQVPGMLRFDVIDTGIGIAADKLGVIFEPFAQADGSITRLFGGTGLGLSITRSIAHLMGGSLQVQSAPGVGSTFTLRLPLRPAGPAEASAGAPAERPAAPADGTAEASSGAAAASAPADAAAGAAAALARAPAAGSMAAHPARGGHAAPAAEPALSLQAGAAGGAPLSVLLAEDNEINVYLFRNMLEGQPLALDFAADGAEALERLRRQRYDIAFIDVQMPGLDGLSVTRALRTLESGGGRARTPVVALTANAFASDLRASFEAGCDRHLTKPYSRQQLIEAIQQLATPLAPPPPPAAVAVGPATAADESIIDRSGAIQRLDGDAALYHRLAGQAAGYMQEWPESFAQARREGSREQAFRLAHDLRSIAQAVGALAVAEHAGSVERSLRRVREEDGTNGTNGTNGDGHAVEVAGPLVLDEAALARTLATLPAVIEALAGPKP